MLELIGVNVYYGSIQALKDVSLRVAEGEIVALIGANGAGKTTLLRTISGLLRPRAGALRYAGESIVGVRPEQLVRRRLVHAPEGRQVFANLTVAENLDLGAYTRSDRQEIRADREMLLALFPGLAERYRQPAGSLSGGEQQMLAIARALMARPRLLLLDEPSLGVAPLLVRDIMGKVRELNQSRGLTLLLVEQNARLALGFARRAYILETGRVMLEGAAADLRSDPRVREHYLGGTA